MYGVEISQTPEKARTHFQNSQLKYYVYVYIHTSMYTYLMTMMHEHDSCPEVSQGQWERALMLLHQMPEWHLTPWPEKTMEMMTHDDLDNPKRTTSTIWSKYSS